MRRTKVAIIGSGNIGTDLMLKVIQLSDVLEMGVMAGIDPASEGLSRAARLGYETTHEGVEGLIASPQFGDVGIVFDATSAQAHLANAERLARYDKTLVDLTPAAAGPFVVPAVNLSEHLRERDVNMVTCGGQATIPVVAAVSAVTPVLYGEITASIASRSAGPGTRANIDEFTEATARAIEQVGGAARGKAIIVLNPAEPPMIMRDTVQLLTRRLDAGGRDAVVSAVERRVAEVAEYVPGYRLKQPVQFGDELADHDVLVPEGARQAAGYTRVGVFLEVKGAGHHLPEYAGNLDIMTSAAMRTAERIVRAAAADAREGVA
ncbi:acetaldehyde dehydrogenase (acetylating) [Myceligenerans indicum]|uniref:Acetaldehyde dehydrogenase n=1 Tax=Myceligenerans indicum TaxID=2593663 RepID=A0ABS1LMI3_9MICO|nr:acetaldehyde dehydrogenase (acetylating) [Myceligenerans indicum]MBL0887416.1 acetaldehyde dehydrogenase (acetylating) [Myceligenerans indicum]